MECPICQTDLNVVAYVQPGVDAIDAEDQEDFRLKCGHAFHIGCLCRALRTETSCPVCRSTTANRENTIQMTLRDGVLEFTINPEDVEEEPTQQPIDATVTTRVEAYMTEFTKVQRLPAVQKARAELRRAKRKYRDMESNLMQVRADVLRDALDTFKSQYQRSFEDSKRALKRALRRVKDLEEKPILRAIPDAQMYMDPYTLADYVGNNNMFGPLKRSFWMH